MRLLFSLPFLVNLTFLAYATFSQWNDDQEISDAAKKLYGDIDRLELYVGLQAEQTKKPGPGAGLCPGYTISRAILSDAVCLTRGDRFLTTDFTRESHTWSRNMILTLHFTVAFSLTAWGWQDCQYDKEDGSYGGLLTKLIFRILPDHYPTGSVLAHFPFNVPESMLNALKKNPGSIQKYCWPERLEDLPDNVERLPSVINPTWRFVRDYEGVKGVLTTENAHFTSNIVRRMESTVELVLEQRVRDFIMFRFSRWRTK